MKLPFHISSDRLIETYREVRNMMDGNDNIIFETMAEISTNGRNSFILPNNQSEFAQKHDEIKKNTPLSSCVKGS